MHFTQNQETMIQQYRSQIKQDKLIMRIKHAN